MITGYAEGNHRISVRGNPVGLEGPAGYQVIVIRSLLWIDQGEITHVTR